jgi:hypothetical protein
LKRPDHDPGEISARLLELQDLMLDAKTSLIEAQEEHTRLQARIADLTRMADFGKDFRRSHGVYWHEAFPYCPTCWDVDRKPVRLAGPNRESGRLDSWTCPLHKASFMLSWNVRAQVQKESDPSSET